MKHASFLTRISDPAVVREERLTLLAQFVLANGISGPDELLLPANLPKGYLFRTFVVRDVMVCLAISKKEAEIAPKAAMPESAQVWQLNLTPSGKIKSRGCDIVYTLNGAVTQVREIRDENRVAAILSEWASEPVTEVELAAPVEPHTLQ